MNDIPPDSLALTGEQKNEVRRMAALGYSPEDIAAYLGLDASECFLLYMTPVFQEPPFEG
jgi:hypothetical protein